MISVYRTLGLTPNQVTLAGLGFGLVAAVCIAFGLPLLALVLWWIGRLLDGTDGIYARATNQASDFGGYLDILADMAAYGAMILGFAVWKPELGPAWMLILFLYILCITSALALGGIETKRQLGQSDNRSMRLAAGLAEGGETGLAYTAMLLFPDALLPLTILWIVILTVTVVARTGLASRTTR